MTVSEIRLWDDLDKDERVALEEAIEEKLIEQAKTDLSNENIDVRQAHPTADVGMDADVDANTWILDAAGIAGPGNYDGFVDWDIGDNENAALYGFWDVRRSMQEVRVSNATTVLAECEVTQVRSAEHAAAFFRQVLLFKKNENMSIDAVFDDAGADAEVVWLIKIAEPAGTTFGTK